MQEGEQPFFYIKLESSFSIWRQRRNLFGSHQLPSSGSILKAVDNLLGPAESVQELNKRIIKKLLKKYLKMPLRGIDKSVFMCYSVDKSIIP